MSEDSLIDHNATARPGKGLDVGTANLLAASQTVDGDVIVKMQRNAFIDIEQTDFALNMLTNMKIQYVILGGKLIVIGDPAFDLANTYNRETRRPMQRGMLSPKELDALPIERLLVDRLLGEPTIPNEVVYYSVPAEPIDFEMNVVYHKGIFNDLLRKLGYSPKDIIEGHAIVFSELDEDDFTGIGISCGGGMFNVCVSYKTLPALSFSTARGGDWIDRNVAKVLGISAARATQIKENGVNLLNPRSREEQSIDLYYRELIRYALKEIKKRFVSADNMPRFPDPVDMVFAGGTSLIGGFIDVVREEVSKMRFPIPIKAIRRAEDPLTSCARGCLVAAAADADNEV